MRTSFRVDGLRDVDRALSELPKATARGVTRRVLIKAAEPVERAAVNNAPEFTGALKKDIETGAKLTKAQARTAKRLGKSEVEVHIGVVDPAGVQTEFGNAHQAAKPWFRPAWDGTQNEALDIIKDEYAGEIEKTRGRLARRAARRGG